MKAILFTALIPAIASAQTISCPQTLPADSVALARPPAGWVATSPAPVWLDGSGMLSGDPKQMQYLVPAQTRKTKAGSASTWHFEPGEEKWLFCTYGRAAVHLSKRMDDKAMTCEIASRTDQSGALVEAKATCR